MRVWVCVVYVAVGVDGMRGCVSGDGCWCGCGWCAVGGWVVYVAVCVAVCVGRVLVNEWVCRIVGPHYAWGSEMVWWHGSAQCCYHCPMALLCRVVLCCAVVWCAVVWRGVVWCALVCCAVLWCGVLCCALVYFSVHHHSSLLVVNRHQLSSLIITRHSSTIVAFHPSTLSYHSHPHSPLTHHASPITPHPSPGNGWTAARPRRASQRHGAGTPPGQTTARALPPSAPLPMHWATSWPVPRAGTARPLLGLPRVCRGGWAGREGRHR